MGIRMIPEQFDQDRPLDPKRAAEARVFDSLYTPACRSNSAPSACNRSSFSFIRQQLIALCFETLALTFRHSLIRTHPLYLSPSYLQSRDYAVLGL